MSSSIKYCVDYDVEHIAVIELWLVANGIAYQTRTVRNYWSQEVIKNSIVLDTIQDRVALESMLGAHGI